MKPFHNVTFELLKDIEKLSINNIAEIILGNVLYCHLENMPSRIRRRGKDEMRDDLNLSFLPPIDKKYIYTLVLDLDETLVHYFYVKSIKLLIFK
jgi:hypothetical protein